MWYILPLAPMYHDSAHGKDAFIDILLLWRKDKTIPHVIGIQNRLFRIAQYRPTKRPFEKDLVSGKRISDPSIFLVHNQRIT